MHRRAPALSRKTVCRALTAAGVVAAATALAIAVIDQQQDDDDEQDPGAVVAAKEVPQTHTLYTPLRSHSMRIAASGCAFFRAAKKGMV